MLTHPETGLPETVWTEGGNPLRSLPYGGQARLLTPAVQAACIAHAKQEWPKEACGLILLLDDVLTYRPCVNMSHTPLDSFRIADDIVMQTYHDETIHGVFHSHPQGELTASPADQRSQSGMEVPFYVCTLNEQGEFMDFWGWGDQLPTPALKARQFRDGVTDCFSLYRHYKFLAEGLVLPDHHRGTEWWDDPEAENPFTEFLHRSGHVDVAPEDIQVGDGITFRVIGGQVSHCGVYVGQGLFLHHLHGKVSKTDPLVMWRKFIHKVVRYKGDA